jgi:tripartite-type tricarboxylate transporter receptor subunit TctC
MISAASFFKRLASAALASALLAFVLSSSAWAAWPDRAITIIVPFPEGGDSDLLARMLAGHLAPIFGQKVIVKNIVGSVGTEGLRAAAAAAPNGYTLVVTTNAALINIQIDKSLPHTAYDTPRDFAPIAYLGSAPNVIIAAAGSDVDDIGELIARAKAYPGKITCATPGIGSSPELAVELLKRRAHIDFAQMPFDGSEPAFMAVTSGATDIAAIGIGGLTERIRSEKVKVLVQTGRERWRDLPNVATMAEAGIADEPMETSLMFAAPAGTPSYVIDMLARATQQILQQADVKADLRKAGFAVAFEGPDELHERVMREIPMWHEIVERVGLSKK